MNFNLNRRIHFPWRGCLSPGTGCPGSLWSPCQQKYWKPIWTWYWGAFLKLLCFSFVYWTRWSQESSYNLKYPVIIWIIDRNFQDTWKLIQFHTSISDCYYFCVARNLLTVTGNYTGLQNTNDISVVKFQVGNK